MPRALALSGEKQRGEGDVGQLWLFIHVIHLDQWFSTSSHSGARSYTGYHLVTQYSTKLVKWGEKSWYDQTLTFIHITVNIIISFTYEIISKTYCRLNR